LLFTSLEGFAIPYVAAPVLGRSVHTLSALLAVLLLAFGLLWLRLRLGAPSSRLVFWFLVYSGLAIVAAFPTAFALILWGLRTKSGPADHRRRSLRKPDQPIPADHP
jgi:hydroxylaminobenzene mutase